MKSTSLRACRGDKMRARPFGRKLANVRMERTCCGTSPMKGCERTGEKWTEGKKEFSRRHLFSGSPL